MPMQPTDSSDHAIEQIQLQPCSEVAYAPRKAAQKYSSSPPKSRDAKYNKTPVTAYFIANFHV
jgi:uncharacterized protein involved in copper resistance